MENKLLLLTAISSIFLTGFFGGGHKTVKLEAPSGYATDAWVYTAEGEQKETGIVFLHGKRGNPGVDHNNKLISRMTDLGYRVIAPIMPWSEKRGYEGTRTEGLGIIDAAAKALGTEKTVVIGHSMGAMAVLQYGAKGASPGVIGLVSVAPGHDPHNAGKLRAHTEEDADKACNMVANDKGKEHDSFADMNGPKNTYSINASAEYYCTYFNVKEYPDSQAIGPDIKTPTFVLSGADDRLTQIYSHHLIYGSISENANNRHEEVPGNHKNVLFKHTDMISQWIESL